MVSSSKLVSVCALAALRGARGKVSAVHRLFARDMIDCIVLPHKSHPKLLNSWYEVASIS